MCRLDASRRPGLSRSRTPNCNGRDILLIDCPFSIACHGVRGRKDVVAFEEPIVHFEEMLRRQKP